MNRTNRMKSKTLLTTQQVPKTSRMATALPNVSNASLGRTSTKNALRLKIVLPFFGSIRSIRSIRTQGMAGRRQKNVQTVFSIVK